MMALTIDEGIAYALHSPPLPLQTLSYEAILLPPFMKIHEATFMWGIAYNGPIMM
jgi:hypothetical protein